jgi:hypothetical protein
VAPTACEETVLAVLLLDHREAHCRVTLRIVEALRSLAVDLHLLAVIDKKRVIGKYPRCAAIHAQYRTRTAVSYFFIALRSLRMKRGAIPRGNGAGVSGCAFSDLTGVRRDVDGVASNRIRSKRPVPRYVRVCLRTCKSISHSMIGNADHHEAGEPSSVRRNGGRGTVPVC